MEQSKKKRKKSYSESASKKLFDVIDKKNYSIDEVNNLLDQGADPNYTKNKPSLLTLSLFTKYDIELFNLLLKRGAKWHPQLLLTSLNYHSMVSSFPGGDVAKRYHAARVQIVLDAVPTKVPSLLGTKSREGEYIFGIYLKHLNKMHPDTKKLVLNHPKYLGRMMTEVLKSKSAKHTGNKKFPKEVAIEFRKNMKWKGGKQTKQRSRKRKSRKRTKRKSRKRTKRKSRKRTKRKSRKRTKRKSRKRTKRKSRKRTKRKSRKRTKRKSRKRTIFQKK